MSTQIDLSGKTILISRTDSIGDVVLTLPICVWIKKHFPDCRIIFLGKTYTKPVLECVEAIDRIVCWDELENLPGALREKELRELEIDVCLHVFPKKEIASLIKKIKVPWRIGTSHRAFHLLSCNVRLNFTRKNSAFHEAQLNFNLCTPFGLSQLPELDYLSTTLQEAFRPHKSDFSMRNLPHLAIILHPKSQGSALEWPIEKYVQLAEKLLAAGEKVVFSGTEKEGVLFRDAIPIHPNCFDMTGKLTLAEFISFIAQSKALLACSTGPYHLAGISGIKAVGLFSSRKPIHPGRWKALGSNAHALVFDPLCPTCAKGKNCSCIVEISVEQVLNSLI